MREIKFRAWDAMSDYGKGTMMSWEQIKGYTFECVDDPDTHLMQFTGLRDKTEHLQEVYEGDIIDEYGKIKGNIYEMDKGEADLVIEGFGTSAWSKTEMAGLARGLKYTK